MFILLKSSMTIATDDAHDGLAVLKQKNCKCCFITILVHNSYYWAYRDAK